MEKLACLRCHSNKVKKHGRYRKHYNRYLCNSCGRTFNDLTGTIFEETKLKVKDWIYIIKEFAGTASKNAVHKESGINYGTVGRVVGIVLSSVEARQLLEKLTGDVIEIDEMYMSVGSKGTRQTERKPRRRGLRLRGRGTGDKDKPPIVGVTVRAAP